MRVLRAWFGLLGTLALAGLSVPAGAQPVGSEFHINTYTTGYQIPDGDRAIASDANGNFVVVWASSPSQDGSDFGIFGQRYDDAGAALGSEFKVNSYTTGHQFRPSVASDANGNFIVVWTSRGQDGSSDGIFGQRFDSDGVAQGAEFQVNSYATAYQRFPSVASDANGNFVVAWHSRQGVGGYDVGIFGQRYDSKGVAQGGEFQVDTSNPSLLPGYPSVAAAADGSFVVVWRSLFFWPISGYVLGRRYDSQGEPQGSEFGVAGNSGYDYLPQVASDSSGNFVVVWARRPGVYGQRFDSSGEPQGGDFQINSGIVSYPLNPSVARDTSGNFLVAWQGSEDGSDPGIFGRRYDSEGAAQGDEFQINSYTTDAQAMPSVAATDSNQFVVAWHSDGQDGDSYGVFGQRFDFGGGTSTIHVGDLDRRAKNVGGTWRAQVKTLVHDDGHSPLSGALVTLAVSGVGTRTCTTTAAGQCEVSVVVPDSVPSLTFTVTNLSKAGFTYTPAANHDPDPDSNGTVIVVNQP